VLRINQKGKRKILQIFGVETFFLTENFLSMTFLTNKHVNKKSNNSMSICTSSFLWTTLNNNTMHIFGDLSKVCLLSLQSISFLEKQDLSNVQMILAQMFLVADPVFCKV
jgi:hypothetical protein